MSKTHISCIESWYGDIYNGMGNDPFVDAPESASLFLLPGTGKREGGEKTQPSIASHPIWVLVEVRPVTQARDRQDLGNLVNQLNGHRQQQHRGSEAEKL